LHEIDELTGHRDPLKTVDLRRFAGADVAARPPKGNRGRARFPSVHQYHYG
jgi:hypothetical protein